LMGLWSSNWKAGSTSRSRAALSGCGTANTGRRLRQLSASAARFPAWEPLSNLGVLDCGCSVLLSPVESTERSGRSEQQDDVPMVGAASPRVGATTGHREAVARVKGSRWTATARPRRRSCPPGAPACRR
jgi:hypothetical protein